MNKSRLINQNTLYTAEPAMQKLTGIFYATLKRFSLLHNAQTGSVAHRVSYPTGTGSSFKATGA
jgi:hypothetical protein